jgi:hypothetical protein
LSTLLYKILYYEYFGNITSIFYKNIVYFRFFLEPLVSSTKKVKEFLKYITNINRQHDFTFVANSKLIYTTKVKVKN